MVFVQKYRRKVFYGQKLHETGKILGELSGWKYAGGDTAEDECVEFYRFSESEKRFDGLRALEQHIATENFGARDTIRSKERP